MLDSNFITNGEEIWEPIPGLEDYQASNLGRIRRATRGRGTQQWRVRKPMLNRRTGRLQVMFRKPGGKQQSLQVHSLVARAFLGLPPKGKEVNHINCEPTDNRAANLEYLTRRENVMHAALSQRLRRGEGCSWSKLTETDVAAIVQKAKTGITQRILAARYGVHQCTISRIVNFRRWKHRLD